MALEVRFRPSGVARVEIVVTPRDGGSEVTLEEHPSAGPVSWVPSFLIDPLLHVRNEWSLRRLRGEVERRDRSGP
jgi:hypothetical protein